MRALAWTWCCAAGLALALAARRADLDFEFDDDKMQAAEQAPPPPPAHPARRYLYDPHSPLCLALQCGAREACVLRDRHTALCADRRALLRDGDVVVAGARDDDEDVFYEPAARPDADAAPDAEADADATPDESRIGDAKPDKCVGCGAGGGAGGGGFLCGSDNRTYSSLCRLDLHNCVRRPRRAVTAQCRGFCPCAPRAAPTAPTAPARRPRLHKARAHLDLDRDDDEWRRRADAAHNEVLPKRRDRTRDRGQRTRLSKGAAETETEAQAHGCELDAMADRLLDWFSVLMAEARAAPPPRAGFPRDCKPEVRWMFSHLDAGADGLLSAADLYALRHDEREQCLRPFLWSCGAAGEGAGGVSRGAWCACLRRAARPCTALARAHPAPHAGAYVPACDARGFYRARQCHPALGVCWCVTPHGVERAGSRTRGAPACPDGDAGAEAAGGAGGAGGAPSDDEDADGEPEGSGGAGGAELRF